MPLIFQALNECNIISNFNCVNIILYTLDNTTKEVYTLLGVKGKIPTLGDIGGNIDKNLSFNICVSNLIKSNTSKTIEIEPEDVNNADILYYTNDSLVKSTSCCLFLNINFDVSNLNILCAEFRINFKKELKKNDSNFKDVLTHLLWINERNLFYILLTLSFLSNT